MHGKFFWYDVMTTDVAAARKFYGEVIGWGAQGSGAAGTDYTAFTVKGQGVAGLMPIPEAARKAGVQPGWMGYVSVDDVDRAAARVEKEGGKVLRPPWDVPGVIRIAVVADPQGAGFMIAKGLIKDAPPPLPGGTPGTVGWHELYATEWKAALSFYEKLFGWTKAEAIDMGPMGTYQLFATGDGAVGGVMNKPAAVPMPHWGYYINVAGLDATIARVKAAAGQIVNGPMQVPGGSWIVNCVDPQNAAFSMAAMQR